ncbi:MAG: hypothetical protein HQL28_07270 [Candidatus Omnitrophica bacterium]|nr:hypothetical protein [Candidatus Omnitrophota bacterium]
MISLKDIVSKFTGAGIGEKRAMEDNYSEFVLLSLEKEKWEPVMESVFGPAAKPRGSRLTKEDAELTKEFGGLWPDQTLYKKEEDGQTVIAMLWPWQDQKHVTVKLAFVMKKDGPKNGFLKKFFAVFFLAIIFGISAYAFEFDGYKWGTIRSDVMSQGTASGKNVTDNRDCLSFEDTMYGKRCFVNFYFTPATKVLSMIKIQWPDVIDPVPLMEFKESLEDTLTKKYGEPSDFLPGQFETHWGVDDSYELIVLKYQPTIELTYYGAHYYIQGIKEADSEKKADDDEL